MNRPGPAPERGGTPVALANLRKGGLKKARGTSVIADMTRTELPEHLGEAPATALHAVPVLDAKAGAQAPEPPRDNVVSAPAQVLPVPAPAPALEDQPETQTTAPAGTESVPAQTQGAEKVPEAAPKLPAAEKKTYRKTSFFQSQESGSRMRSAYMATRHLTGYRTLSDFILAAVEREVDKLEKQHNGGDVFDADPGSVPRGRPLEL